MEIGLQLPCLNNKFPLNAEVVIVFLKYLETPVKLPFTT